MERSTIRFFLLFSFITCSSSILGAYRDSIHTIQLKDYILHYKQHKLLVIHKNTLETHQFLEKRLEGVNKVTTVKNRLILRNNYRTAFLDIEKMIRQPTGYQSKWIYITSVLTFGVIFFIIRYTLHEKQSSTPEPAILEKHNYYDKITSHVGEKLRTHEMDTLFDIDKLSYDSRKLKRHRLIQEINKKHPDLIQRVKDIEDQRKYLYIINQQNEQTGLKPK